jgi:hypothetical protein
MDILCHTFAVDRGDLARTTVLSHAEAPPAPGEVVLRVDTFALTANNTTYADLGDQLGYWRFFPAEAPWGVIPVWGFADVVASACDGIQPGERLYGYWPMATHARLTPVRVTAGSLVDASEHRQALPAAYNLYLRTAGDPAWRADLEAIQALLRPVFITSFLIDDLLGDVAPPPEQVVLTSASSKTALGLAWLLQRRGVAVAGLTSAGNLAFVEGLGCYGTVLPYDRLDALPRGLCSATVDFAGSSALRQRVRDHLDDPSAWRLAVGFTHRDATPEADPPPFFSAPDRLRQRGRDWGRDEIARRVAERWADFAPWVAQRLTVQAGRGLADVEAVYRQLLAGGVPANVGHVLSPQAQQRR